MTILVTGTAGFIGNFLALRLLERPSSPATQALKHQLHAALNEAHPLIGEVVTTAGQ